jgi:hypothetical protein
MRLAYFAVAIGFIGVNLVVPRAEADCSMEGHPICNFKCSGTCRAYYNAGPPETCEHDCRNFLVKPGDFTIKLEGITNDQRKAIDSIINEK